MGNQQCSALLVAENYHAIIIETHVKVAQTEVTQEVLQQLSSIFTISQELPTYVQIDCFEKSPHYFSFSLMPALPWNIWLLKELHTIYMKLIWKV